MNPCQGLVIPADTTQPLHLVAVTSIDDYQAIVGGYIEAVSHPSGTMIYLNEEGKALALPYNIRVDAFARECGIAPDDFIVGDVILLGPCDNNGDDTDITAEVVNRFAQLYGTITSTEGAST